MNYDMYKYIILTLFNLIFEQLVLQFKFKYQETNALKLVLCAFGNYCMKLYFMFSYFVNFL